jgi:G3E family GTPase
VYLVNEFGEVDIDGRILEGMLAPEDEEKRAEMSPEGETRRGECASLEVVSIPGGSIFCRCLVSEFVRVLRQTACEGGAPPDAVVIEASGIADPKIIAQMLAETHLDQQYDLRQVVSVVDPGSFLKLVDVLPNIVAQVEAADVVIVNKADLYDVAQVQATEEAVRRINPASAVVRAEHCRVSDEMLTLVGQERYSRAAGGDYAACVDPNYIRVCVSLDRPVNLDGLLAALGEIQPHVYRVKGFVPVSGGRVYIDVSAGGVECRPVCDGPRPLAGDSECRVVFIAGPASREWVERLAGSLRPGRVTWV